MVPDWALATAAREISSNSRHAAVVNGDDLLEVPPSKNRGLVQSLDGACRVGALHYGIGFAATQLHFASATMVSMIRQPLSVVLLLSLAAIAADKPTSLDQTLTDVSAAYAKLEPQSIRPA